MTVKVQVLRSATASKRPTSTALLDGELALNTNAGTSGIFFEDAGGTIRKVGPAEVGGSAPNASPASGGSAGNSTGEFWYDTANTAGNSQDLLKIYNGSAWVGPGDVTIGSTNIGVGDSATTAIAGLTSLASGTLTASTGIVAENQGYLELREQSGNGSNYIRLVAPNSVTNNTTLKLPDGDGSNENVLITDGSGNLSWAAPAGTTVETQNASNANSTHYLTFVQDDNSAGSPQDELVYTDASLAYNPATNVLSGAVFSATSQVSTAAIVLNGTTITSTGHELNILDGATLNVSELNTLTGITATTAELNFVDGVTSNVQTQLNNKGSLANQNALITLTGVAAGSTGLGTFTGSTISDDEDIKEALQDLETAIEAAAGGGAAAASVATITDNTNASRFLTFVNDDNVSSTQEVVKTDAGISYNPSTNILTVTGSVVADVTGDVTGNSTSSDTVDVTDASSVNSAFNILFTDGDGAGKTIREDTGLLYNPSSNTLTAGTFSGALTGDVTGTADKADKVSVVKNETTGTYFFTFVDSNNTGAAYESLYTDTALNLNPATNIVSGGGMDMVAYFINSVQITATATELNVLDGITSTTAELNILDGVTATAAELNILDGVTATATELNYSDGVTSNIQTQLNAKQATISGGDGIAVSSNSVAVDLTAASSDLVLSGYTSTQSFLNATYTILTGFSGTISGSGGTSTMTFASNSSYNIYVSTGNSRIIAYNTTESSWMAAFAPSGIGSPSNGSTFTVSTQAYDLPTGSSVIVNSKSSPDASSWSEGSYSSGQEPFLAFTGGQLYALALDEDDMASNSASHLATQQSIKAYVDAIDKDRIIDGDTSVTVDGTNDTVIFATNGSNKWVIGTNGNMLPITASAYDIGASGSEVDAVFADNLYGTLQTASQTNITGVGTLTAGTWNGSVIGAQYGGTGLNGASAANGSLLIGNGSGYTLSTLTEGQSITVTNAGGSITVAADLASAAGSSATANAGVASFSSDQFAVDNNGYVTHAGGFGLSTITADSGSTSPSGNGITVAGGTGLTSTGSGASLTLKLDDTAVTAASYGSASAVPSFTVDAQGRLTAAADVSISIAHTAVTDFDAGVQTNRLDQMATPTASVAMGAQKITGLADPTADQDAATKKYVDDTAQGLNTKQSVEVATTAALPAFTYSNGSSGVGATITADNTGVVTIDGTSLAADERILIKNETGGNLPYNGIYTVTTVGDGSTALVLTRATDQDSNLEFAGAYVFVESGTTNANAGFVCTAEDPFTVGTSGVTWEQFSGAGQVDAGDGLTKSGNTLNVGGTANRISVSANAVDISTSYVGQTSITTLGTISSGTWNGDVVGLSYGGTGVDNTSITARHALIGPTSGTGNASFRALVADDIASGEFDAGTY